ncbi:DUF4258 domain-containing protein [Candidatus Woesearchaeota archaeon]|nr:DUF4258 domain-containing protein [Candidatus Woesearchaeota archaeon]
MAEIVINTSFKNTKHQQDSEKRSEHILDRMATRGITKNDIKEAVQKGPKNIRKDNSIITEFKWFKVIYREYRLNDIRKIYPITVID